MTQSNNAEDISRLHELFTRALQAEVFAGNPKELYEPFNYILSLGGKRIRPVIVLLSCELFCGNPGKAMHQAIAIELFHNFTLIHDDIMDHAPLRRGLPTVHEKFNTPVAILSGDVMLVYAYKYLLNTELSLIPELMELFNDCAVKVCEGQQLDMNFESVENPSARQYLEMIELKTSTLLATAFKIGALIGGANSADANAIYQFGLRLGVSFQLKDDWLDTFGDAGKFGKQPGGDIIQNKKTLLLIEALKKADHPSRSELLRWYADRPSDPKEKLKSVTTIYRDLRIDEIILASVEEHFNFAVKWLEDLSLSKHQKERLAALAHRLLNRQY